MIKRYTLFKFIEKKTFEVTLKKFYSLANLFLQIGHLTLEIEKHFIMRWSPFFFFVGFKPEHFQNFKAKVLKNSGRQTILEGNLTQKIVVGLNKVFRENTQPQIPWKRNLIPFIKPKLGSNTLYRSVIIVATMATLFLVTLKKIETF